MEFRILGPLEVLSDGKALDLGGAKQRALLAVLLVHANHVVSRDRLVDALWESDPPESARKALQGYVSALRKLLGKERLETRPPGYLLRVVAGELDFEHFRHLREQERLAEALALWRGPPLSDFASQHFAQAEIARLEDQRLACLEERIERELDAGDYAELTGELEALVAENPLRERLRAQLMLALYRSDRQAEALGSYTEARRLLVEELGLEPGSALRELHVAILRQDPALELTETQSRVPTARFPSGRGALPVGLTRLVGRADQVDEICARLRGDARILTLTGPGGIGKTRVAIEVAERLAPEYADGARFVALAPIFDPELVGATIANSLGLRPTPGQALLEALVEGVRDAALLLVLDNYEHVLEAAPLASELAQSAAGLKIVATSRAPLHIRGEHVSPVPSLTVPPADADLDELEASSSVALFVERARAAEPSFELTPSNAQAVAEVCQRLDGLPLAIELAAARVAVLPPEMMLSHLDRVLPLLSGGPRDAPERQQTLEATIAWSHELLAEPEQRLFARLSVFTGGCTLEAAERICDADLTSLASLVDTSLLRQSNERFWMLETIREFALERLGEGESEGDVHRRYADYFLSLAEANYGVLFDELTQGQLDWFERERDNLRAALDRLQESAAPELELRLVAACVKFWIRRGDWNEARPRVEAALERAHTVPPSLRALLLWAAADLAWPLGEYDRGKELAGAALSLYEQLGTIGPEPVAARNILAKCEFRLGNTERAVEIFESAAATARAISDERMVALALNGGANIALDERDFARARPLIEESAEINRRLGRESFLANDLVDLGFLALAEGQLDEAAASFRESLPICRTKRIAHTPIWVLEGIAAIALARDTPTLAVRLLAATELARAAQGFAEGYYPIADEVRVRTLEAARENLGEAAFDAAWAEGRRLSIKEAAANAGKALMD